MRNENKVVVYYLDQLKGEQVQRVTTKKRYDQFENLTTNDELIKMLMMMKKMVRNELPKINQFILYFI